MPVPCPPPCGDATSPRYTNAHGQQARDATAAAFNSGLAKSETPQAAALLDVAYTELFSRGDTPVFAVWRDRSRHTAAQARGHDATIETTAPLDLLLVEEKWRPTRASTDVALELFHQYTDGRLRKGWMHVYPSPDHGGPDLLAMAFGRDGAVFVCPWSALQWAYSEHGAEWRARVNAREPGWRIARADNGDFITYSIVVPIAVLLDAIPLARVIRQEEAE